MTALLWSGSCLLSGLAGAACVIVLQRALSRDGIRHREPQAVDHDMPVESRIRYAEGS